MMRRTLWGFAGVALLLACNDRPTVVTAPRGVLAQSEASKNEPLQRPGYVLTPAGWFHSSCVHEIPAGARVSINHVVTRKDGTSYQIPKCLFPAFLTLPHGRQRLA